MVVCIRDGCRAFRVSRQLLPVPRERLRARRSRVPHGVVGKGCGYGTACGRDRVPGQLVAPGAAAVRVRHRFRSGCRGLVRERLPSRDVAVCVVCVCDNRPVCPVRFADEFAREVVRIRDGVAAVCDGCYVRVRVIMRIKPGESHHPDDGIYTSLCYHISRRLSNSAQGTKKPPKRRGYLGIISIPRTILKRTASIPVRSSVFKKRLL